MEAGVRRIFHALLPALVLLAAGCVGTPPAGAPAAAAPLAPAQARILFSKAEGYFHKGLYPEAIREYTALIAADPANAVAFRCRAAARAALREDAAAAADYDLAIALDPRNDDAWLGRGLFHFAHGKYADAIDDFDHVIALDPGGAVAHRYRALACEKIGKYREAGESRQAYIHCTLPREDSATRERPPARELRALGLE